MSTPSLCAEEKAKKETGKYKLLNFLTGFKLLFRKPYTRMFAILYQMKKGTIAGRNEETKTKDRGKERRHEGTEERRNDRAAVNKRRKE